MAAAAGAAPAAAAAAAAAATVSSTADHSGEGLQHQQKQLWGKHMALTDIAAGQLLTTSYLPANCSYMSRQAR
jgi:predicted porin